MKTRPFLAETTRSERMAGRLTACAGRLLQLLRLCTLPAAVHSGDFLCTVEDGVVTITKHTGPGTAVIIPNMIDGLPVTRLGYRAFEDRTQPTGITIPDSVTSIGDRAFSGCTSPTNVTITNGEVVIGHGVFRGCNTLDYAKTGSGAMLLRKGPCPSGSESIEATINGLPVTHLGEDLFSGCTSLTDATIPDAVTTIGNNAFKDCTGLTAWCAGWATLGPSPALRAPSPIGWERAGVRASV